MPAHSLPVRSISPRNYSLSPPLTDHLSPLGFGVKHSAPRHETCQKVTPAHVGDREAPYYRSESLKSTVRPAPLPRLAGVITNTQFGIPHQAMRRITPEASRARTAPSSKRSKSTRKPRHIRKMSDARLQICWRMCIFTLILEQIVYVSLFYCHANIVQRRAYCLQSKDYKFPSFSLEMETLASFLQATPLFPHPLRPNPEHFPHQNRTDEVSPSREGGLQP